MAAEEITCQEVLELLTEYLEGALAPGLEASVAAHLEGCHPCREYLGQLEATIAATASLREEAVPEQVREALLGAFRTWVRPTP